MAEEITITTPYGEAPAMHWYLVDRETMWQALKELVDEDRKDEPRWPGTHRGTVMEWPDGNGGQAWQMEANDETGNRVSAFFGQHLVLELGGKLMCYEQAYYETIKVQETEEV